MVAAHALRTARIAAASVAAGATTATRTTSVATTLSGRGTRLRAGGEGDALARLVDADQIGRAHV